MMEPFAIQIDTVKMALCSEPDIKLHFAALHLAIEELQQMVLATKSGDEYASDGYACVDPQSASNWGRLAQACYERAEAHKQLALVYGNWGSREEAAQPEG